MMLYIVVILEQKTTYDNLSLGVIKLMVIFCWKYLHVDVNNLYW